jgi:hypothetical protein
MAPQVASVTARVMERLIARALERLIRVLFYRQRGGPVVGVTHTSTTDQHSQKERCCMDIASERDNSKAYRPGPLQAVVQAVRDMVARVYGFFALTEDERLKVGIYLGGMEQDQ